MRAEPLDVPGLGLAFAVEPKVAAVVPGSPAAKAGIKPGDSIRHVDPTSRQDRRTARPTWPRKPAVLRRQDRRLAVRSSTASGPRRAGPRWTSPDGPSSVELIARGPTRTGSTRSAASSSRTLTATTPPSRSASPCARGPTTRWRTYLDLRLFRSLVQGRSSPDNLGGPILIAQLAYRIAKSGD